MKSVAITGYCGTGSSAFVDLLKEYNTTDIGKFPDGNYEQIFLYDVNGVFDTVDRLINANNLHNSNAIINQFRAEMLKLHNSDFGWFGGYKYLCGDAFINIIEDFISDITSFRLNVNWYGTYDKKVYSIDRMIKDFIKLILGKRYDKHNFGKKTLMISNNRNEFSYADPTILKMATQKLIVNYLDIFFDSDKIAVLDHLLMPQDAKRLEDYTPNDLKMIIVDRDIRDLFIYSKYIWDKEWGDGIYFPTDVYEYIEFIKQFRATEKKIDSGRLLRVQFEDLVYNYNKTVNETEQFVGLNSNDHNNKFKSFDPNKSIKNTQVFNIDSEWKKEADIILKALPHLCYDFPYENTTSINEVFGG